jgi:GTP cyclohydrolase I
MPGQNPWSGIPPEIRAGMETQLRLNELVQQQRDLQRSTPASFRQMALESEAKEAATVLLRLCAGLDPNDIHGQDTPQRFVDMLRELTTPPEIKWKTFPNDGMDEMVVLEGIPFHSLCEHHVIPFMGLAYVGYVPQDEIAGLSKFARVVKHFAARLQVQERLTMQIADYLEEHLKPRGVGVVMRAEHLCMTIRGVQAPGTKTYTAAMRGVFGDHTRTAKAEFLSQINGRH